MENTVARILDANLNRAREGLRIIEEIFRFGYNDYEFALRCKEARHKLRLALIFFPNEGQDLLWSRDSAQDVGAKTFTDGEAKREDLAQIFFANIKRVQEATRALEEFSKSINGQSSQLFKEVRFMAYVIEKEGRATMVQKNWQERLAAVELYVITGDKFAKGRTIVKTMAEAIAGGAQMIQLREKNLSTLELIEVGKELRALTREKDVIFVVNDRVDIAKAVDADGVHLGQDDLPVAMAREIMGADKIIGVSTHSVEQALKAEQDGADYIGVGPVFATDSKEDVCAPVGLELVKNVSGLVSVPFVAIGGIKLHNLKEVLDQGAKRVCVITEVVGAEDIEAAAKALRDSISEYKKI